MTFIENLISFIFLSWNVLTIVQIFFGYGTAYRLAKNGGDNGIALFGWMILMSFVAPIPGLGIFLWLKYK